MTMRKLNNDFKTRRGGYGSPELTLFETAPEEGFATSQPDWNNGSIGDTSGNYNTWEKL